MTIQRPLQVSFFYGMGGYMVCSDTIITSQLLNRDNDPRSNGILKLWTISFLLDVYY